MSRQTIKQRRALARAERKREEAERRYRKTRSHAALIRLKDAVTEALRAASLRSGRTAARPADAQGTTR